MHFRQPDYHFVFRQKNAKISGSYAIAIIWLAPLVSLSLLGFFLTYKKHKKKWTQVFQIYINAKCWQSYFQILVGKWKLGSYLSQSPVPSTWRKKLTFFLTSAHQLPANLWKFKEKIFDQKLVNPIILSFRIIILKPKNKKNKLRWIIWSLEFRGNRLPIEGLSICGWFWE